MEVIDEDAYVSTSSTSSTQRATVRFVYSYARPANVAEVRYNDHIKLADTCKERLRELNQNQSDAIYPWDCYSDVVESGFTLVQLSVRFVHRHCAIDSGEVSLHAKQLWCALVDLFNHEPSHTLFGGRICSINMYPVTLKEGVPVMSFTFGQLVGSLAVKSDPMEHVGDILETPSDDTLAVAAETFLLILQLACTGAALYVGWGWGEGGRKCLQSAIIYASSNAVELYRSETVGTSDASVPTKIAPPKGELSPQQAFQWVAQFAGNTRRLVQLRLNPGATKETYSKVAEAMKEVMSAFLEVHRAAVARLRYLLEKDVPSAEQYVEAKDCLLMLMDLSRRLRPHSKGLGLVLQKQRRNRNTRIATVGATAAVSTAIAVFAGPLAWAPFCWYAAQTGTAIAAASASHLLVKSVEEGPQIENLQQNGQDVDKAHLKVLFLTSTGLITNVWKMDLDSMAPSEKENLLGQFGVDPEYFAEKNYTKAHLSAALDELERVHGEHLDDINGLFLDLKIEEKAGSRKLTRG
ncbi:hypothetical protein K505DRAFT_372121 [Melanomma pulvis-pyrius CBS 109.77]|uniref:Uncharacterized protein n=1 Tax=Melanomma pulvis-pyrius CBS 109.77 TaxID=1314802 RepID=A0A6A6XMV7_9PLEO|nr:hypothetical protein K505DRAFT_372121 [Melanomma pulvis-pyrius CBS 109.77]